MLKTHHKSVLIYLCYCFFLREYLSWSTLLMAGFGATCIFLEIKLPKYTRTTISIALFGSYWFIYGKVIDPEVGMNFLTSVIMVKMLEKDTRRDQYMIFFGLILLLSAGSLFEKNLSYVSFYTVAFLVLIHDFYSELNISFRLKDLFVAIIWVLPLTGALFFFAPRMLNPLPFNQKAKTEGKVGYSPDVNISEVESLASNEDPVFQAQVESKLTQRELYWRGNTLAYTDGWNWTAFRERPGILYASLPDTWPGIKQEIRLLDHEEFLFALDRPSVFSWKGMLAETTDTFTMPQRNREWVAHYEVKSFVGSHRPSLESQKSYLRVFLHRQDKEWIHQNFKAQDLKGLSQEVESYFQAQKFSYSLAPGRINSFARFMREKKVGFCSHYASALAQILRVKGIPSRLVSGFMGGNFNQYAQFYLITQNDAHTWVEAFENNQWVRLDPTEWIAPERVILGGEAYMQSKAPQSTLANMGLKFNVKWLQDFRHWFAQWDYRFYRWLDQMDYHGQLAFLSKFKLTRQMAYSLIPLMILAFVLVYAWQLNRALDGQRGSELDRLWQAYLKKMKKHGLELKMTSIQEALTQLHQSTHPEKNRFIHVFQELTQMSFAQRKEDSLSRMWQDIKRL